MTEPATFLDRAQAEVAEMWEECSNLSDVQMASANDTIHFLHEEAGEVVKCAMHLGLIGDKTYFRSNKVRETVYTWKDLIGEIGDVILMALTLAEAFDVNASVCLQAALDKFYTRARTQAMQEAEEQCDRIEIPFGMGAHPLARGLSILQSDARHRVTNCEGFQPGGLTGNEPDYCKLCGVHKEYHGPGGAERLSFFQEPEGVEPADELDRQKGE